MKFERLSSNRIKIFVTEEDLDLWGLSVQHIVKNTPEAQEIFWYIIKKAESETGFVAGESRLMVEALPQKGTGILLFMTKLEGEESRRGEPAAHSEKKDDWAISFPSFDAVCEAVKALSSDGAGRLYEWGGRYILVLSAAERRHWHRLTEYGDDLGGDPYQMALLREHGTLVCERNAIRTIRTYFG